MKFKQLSLEEYQSITKIPFLEKQRKNGQLPYLEECLQSGTAEYYIINYNNQQYSFWFYKNGNIADLCLTEKNPKSLFDNEIIIKGIFHFLQSKGYKNITMTLPKKQYHWAIKYGFKKTKEIKYGTREFIEWEKEL